MSDHNYVPSSKLGKWFNDRLPLLSLSAHLSEYPTPKNLNYWWTFGGYINFLFIGSNHYRNCIGYALCSPSRSGV